MAAANPAEKLQCLAFAYFAINKSKSTLEGFTSELTTISGTGTNMKYKPYLTSAFDFAAVARKFSAPSSAEDRNWISSTFHVAEKFYKLHILTPFSEYVFLDQSTQFTQTIKDRSLQKYKKALKFSGEIDLLSSIDMFMVRKRRMSEIYRDFKKNILDVDELTLLNNLAYGKTGKNTYRTLVNKYFSPAQGRALVPISLKKSYGTPQITFVGTTINIDQPEIKLDPYTEFISRAMDSNPQELKTLIESMVEIETDTNRMKVDHAVYNIPFTLNYKKANITDFISENQLTLQAGNGFNMIPKGKPYVGGVSFNSSIPFLAQYSEYSRMMAELKLIRRKALYYALTRNTNTAPKITDSNLGRMYDRAYAATQYTGILYEVKRNKDVNEFLIEYDKKMGTTAQLDYYKGVTNLCKKRNISQDISPKMTMDPRYSKTGKLKKSTIEVDYINAQGLWFFSRGGPKLHYYIKQRIALTLYGVISKKGAMIFKNTASGTVLQDAIRAEFKKNKKTTMANFNLAPHILID